MTTDSIQLFVQIITLAIFLSVNNFVASIGMGFSHIWSKIRWKIAIAFGLFDFIAPLVGLYIGNITADTFGKIVGFIGVLILVSLGVYLIYDGSFRHKGSDFMPRRGRGIRHELVDKVMTSNWAIILIAMGISLDNFLVGCGLGAFEGSIFFAAIIFGVVTFSMTLLGVFIGNKMRIETELKIINFAGRGRIITGSVFIIIAVWKLFEIL